MHPYQRMIKTAVY
ncbi:TPA: hypothetical protein JBF73_02710 [Legionella pneumophila]|nr:hypothetical protein [Legionella pneumophila]